MYFKSIFHFIRLYKMSWKSGHIPSRSFWTEIVNYYTNSNSDLLLRQESQCCHLWSHRSRAQIPIWFPQVQFHRRHFGIVLFPWTLEQSKKSLKWFNQIYNILMVEFGQDFLNAKVNFVCLLHVHFLQGYTRTRSLYYECIRLPITDMEEIRYRHGCVLRNN